MHEFWYACIIHDLLWGLFGSIPSAEKLTLSNTACTGDHPMFTVTLEDQVVADRDVNGKFNYSNSRFCSVAILVLNVSVTRGQTALHVFNNVSEGQAERDKRFFAQLQLLGGGVQLLGCACILYDVLTCASLPLPHTLLVWHLWVVHIESSLDDRS